MLMRPAVGSTSPMIMAMVVVLPAPLPPDRPAVEPRAMRNEMSSTAGTVLYILTRRSTAIAGSACGTRCERVARGGADVMERSLWRRSLGHCAAEDKGRA